MVERKWNMKDRAFVIKHCKLLHKRRLSFAEIDQEQEKVSKKYLVRQMLVEKHKVAYNMKPAHYGT